MIFQYFDLAGIRKQLEKFRKLDLQDGGIGKELLLEIEKAILPLKRTKASDKNPRRMPDKLQSQMREIFRPFSLLRTLAWNENEKGVKCLNLKVAEQGEGKIE